MAPKTKKPEGFSPPALISFSTPYHRGVGDTGYFFIVPAILADAGHTVYPGSKHVSIFRC
jgi:hypothetical protein